MLGAPVLVVGAVVLVVGALAVVLEVVPTVGVVDLVVELEDEFVLVVEVVLGWVCG